VSERKSLTTIVDERFPPEKCGTCRFWQEGTDATWPNNRGESDTTGHCRRLPPVMVGKAVDPACDQSRYLATQFPVTDSGDWCGEWRSKPFTHPTPPQTPASGST
jgi:hypothetical protein